MDSEEILRMKNASLSTFSKSASDAEMAGLGDALTIGIFLTLIFGAICFYLYSRMSQTEKRLGLTENLLLSLKMNMEASLEGPDSVEPVSEGMPLSAGDVDVVQEENYAEMLKEIPVVERSGNELGGQVQGSTDTVTAVDSEAAAEELLRSMETPVPSMSANYESMTLKEVQALAKERGITGVSNRKKDLIDALKKQGGAPPSAPMPLPTQPGDLEGGSGDNGYTVSLENA
jgi:hypothetical protein